MAKGDITPNKRIVGIPLMMDTPLPQRYNIQIDNPLKGLRQGFRDADKDKVPNMLDCEPNNPTKQGFIHDTISKIKQKMAERKEHAEEERVVSAGAAKGSIETEDIHKLPPHLQRAAAKAKIRSVQAKARLNQQIKTAEYREQVKADIERKRIKQRTEHPFGGSIFSVPQEFRARPIKGSKGSNVYIKKGKKFVKVSKADKHIGSRPIGEHLFGSSMLQTSPLKSAYKHKKTRQPSAFDSSFF